MVLEEFFNQNKVLDLSFFNFENAITAAYFWSAPIGWSSLNVNAWRAFGLWPSCFPALVVYSPRRCGA